MKKTKLHVYYDPAGDFLEIQLGKASPGYFEQVEDDTFVRKDERTGEVKGVAFFNVQKRTSIRDIDVALK